VADLLACITYTVLKQIFWSCAGLSISWESRGTRPYLVTASSVPGTSTKWAYYGTDRAFTMPPSYGMGPRWPHPHVHLADQHMAYVGPRSGRGRSNEAQIARGPPRPGSETC